MIQRTLLSTVAVLAASVLSVAVARGTRSNAGADAPAYRQLGDAASPVVIEEFSDFECPACRVAEEPLKQVLKLYPQARFIFKHYPLEQMHHSARRAATAAECAGRQGKFFPLHDSLYEKQSEWPKAKDPAAAIDQLAAKAGVEPKAYNECLSDPSVNAAIDADVKEGDQRWVQSTPTFFINGKRFVGAKQLQVRGSSWIEKQLKGKR